MKKLQFIDIGNLFRIIGKICKDIERQFRFKGINVRIAQYRITQFVLGDHLVYN